MVRSIAEGLEQYFLACPLLKDGVFRVDALGDQAVEYVIETGVFEPVIQQYVNGDSERQYQFNFGSREYYGMDRVQNIANSSFYEDFAAWIEEQNAREVFPELPEGCEPWALEVLSSGYLYDGSLENARYQIQLRLTYYKHKKEVM